MIICPSTTSCSYSAPPCPLAAPSTRWYHRLDAGTSATAIIDCGRTDGIVGSLLMHRPYPDGADLALDESERGRDEAGPDLAHRQDRHSPCGLASDCLVTSNELRILFH